jgi:hypothetical protein
VHGREEGNPPKNENKHTNSSTTIPIFLHDAAASVDFVSFSELIPRH